MMIGGWWLMLWLMFSLSDGVLGRLLTDWSNTLGRRRKLLAIKPVGEFCAEWYGF